MITSEEIEAGLEYLASLPEKETRKLMLKFQKKQEPLLVYTAAIIAREELNDTEQDLLTTTVLLFWKLTMEASPAQRVITIDELEAADTKMRQELEDRLESGEEELVEGASQKVAELERYGQPAMIDFLLREIMEVPEESEIRDELKGILFYHLTVVMEALLTASS